MKVTQLKIQIKAYAFIFAALFLAACNTNEPGEDPKPTFPDKQELTISKPGEKATLEFDANYPWTLTSDRAWCKFLVDDENLSSVQNVAGAYSITVIITEDAWDFEDQIATITMGMTKGTESPTKVIATLTRSAQEYKATAYGDTEEDVIDKENPMQLLWYDHGGSIQKAKLNFLANFNWTLKEYPEWLTFTDDIAYTGKAGELMSTTCSFNTTVSYSNELSGELVYTDNEGVERLRLPVYYEGMPATKVEFTIPSKAGFKLNYWFDILGTSYWHVSTDGAELGRTEGKLPIVVKANEKEALRLICFAEDATGNLSVLPEKDYWFSINEPNKGNNWTINIKPQENTTPKERKVRLVVLTESVFNDDVAQGNPSNLLERNEILGVLTVKDAYADYIAIAFTQKAKAQAEASFTVAVEEYVNYQSQAGEALKVEALTGADVEATYGTSHVYKCSFSHTNLPARKRLFISGTSFNLNDAFMDGNVNYNDASGQNTAASGGWKVSPTFVSPSVVFKIEAPGNTPMQIRCTIDGVIYVLVLEAI